MKKIILFLILIVVVTGCDDKIQCSELVGKTKKEILIVAFEKFPRVMNNELEISVRNLNGSVTSNYFSSIDEAEKDRNLVGADVIYINYRKSSWFSKTTHYSILTFNNNICVKVENGSYADF